MLPLRPQERPPWISGEASVTGSATFESPTKPEPVLTKETAVGSGQRDTAAASEPLPETPSPTEDLDLIDLSKKPPHLARYTSNEEGIHLATNEEIDACFQYFAERLDMHAQGSIIVKSLFR